MSIAPPKKVSGIVMDEEGNLLEGVHVYYQKGTQKIGIVTNADGEFWLDQVPANAVVKFSYSGVEDKFFTYDVPKKVVLNLAAANTLDNVNLVSKKKDYSLLFMVGSTLLAKLLAPKNSKALNGPYIKEATL